ncbi:hypothetical protein OFO03_04970 [Campylobacter sp. JMF_02 ED1]|nr:hypothetical protein [Campylobacter sp. JMF_02 ED1]MDA3051242.1 hypothetical protein [Campylobacter sp. JMF_02 ED1]
MEFDCVVSVAFGWGDTAREVVKISPILSLREFVVRQICGNL